MAAVRLAALPAVLLACAGHDATRPGATAGIRVGLSSTTTILRPSAPGEVVFRVGGYELLTPEDAIEGPTLTVYGDGTVIAGEHTLWTTYRISRADLDKLAADAVAAGLTESPYGHVGPVQGADDHTGYSLQINVQQREYHQSLYGDFTPELAHLQQFSLQLTGLRARALPGTAGSWTPEKYLVNDPDRLCFTFSASAGRTWLTWAVFPDLASNTPTDLIGQRTCQ